MRSPRARRRLWQRSRIEVWSWLLLDVGLTTVDKLDAAILRVRRLVAPLHCRALLAVAHRGDLRLSHTLQHQRATHRLRATLAEADVVLARAALVRVAF